jgi:Zn-dependent protease with chaperone function
MRAVKWSWLALPAVALVLVGCAGLETQSPTSRGPAPSPSAGQPAPTPAGRRVEPRDAQRLSRIMVPLLRAADNPRPLDQVRVGVLADDAINAASAGGGEFYVTRGLLARASDEQLAAVLAHEIAHDDLGHVAKAQAVGAGVEIGAAILDQIFPGAGQIAPVAGTLISRAYSRREELEADRHGVEILQRAALPKDAMERTLVWLESQTGGSSGGGFFSTHPGTDERIAALRKLR